MVCQVVFVNVGHTLGYWSQGNHEYVEGESVQSKGEGLVVFPVSSGCSCEDPEFCKGGGGEEGLSVCD
jgi:hypothetical protein